MSYRASRHPCFHLAFSGSGGSGHYDVVTHESQEAVRLWAAQTTADDSAMIDVDAEPGPDAGARWDPASRSRPHRRTSHRHSSLMRKHSYRKTSR